MVGRVALALEIRKKSTVRALLTKWLFGSWLFKVVRNTSVEISVAFEGTYEGDEEVIQRRVFESSNDARIFMAFL
jgi:hypothetical protein